VVAHRTRRRHGGQAVKIVVTGPFSAGKTTLIRTISEITVLSTERGITDDTRSRKAETTVAMDFGRITIDRDLVLYLFGTPGQERFDFMWEILGEGMLGFVLLLDSSRDDPFTEARVILDAFERMARVPYVIAVNRMSAVSPATAAAVRRELGVGDHVAVLGCDATDKESVKAVLLALLYAVLEDIEADTAVQA
jgi:small GTP-binding protein